ncbi:MAG: type III secretion protein [Verrucomicrobia bacterium]|nr:type III secretion protein [Verrucomicrobiota bacterium]
MSPEFLVTWLMVFLRSLGVILQLPVVAGRPLPVTVRAGLCFALAAVLTPLVPAAAIPPGWLQFLLNAVREMILGLLMGFVVRLVFGAVEMAGRIISSEVGLNAPPGMGVPEPANEPLASLASTFAIVLFFLFGGHHGVLTALAHSFRQASAGRLEVNPQAAWTLMQDTAHLIELGLRIAAPFIAMNFLATLAFAVLARAVPRTSVFIISLSAKALLGLGLLAASGGLIARYLFVEFADLPLRMIEMLPAR